MLFWVATHFDMESGCCQKRHGGLSGVLETLRGETAQGDIGMSVHWFTHQRWMTGRYVLVGVRLMPAMIAASLNVLPPNTCARKSAVSLFSHGAFSDRARLAEVCFLYQALPYNGMRAPFTLEVAEARGQVGDGDKLDADAVTATTSASMFSVRLPSLLNLYMRE